jgi:hypothetical protein
MGGDVERRPFVVVCKTHIRIAYPLDSAGHPVAPESAQPLG